MRKTRAGVLLSAIGLLVMGACGGEVEDVVEEEAVAERPLGPVDGFELPGIDLERLTVGMEAPDFTLESYGGERVTLSDFRGERTVLLVFYRGHW